MLKYILTLVFLNSAILPFCSLAYQDILLAVDSKKEIELLGSLSTPGLKSASNPIRAFILNNQLNISFLKKKLGTISIVISSSSNVVKWEQSINTSITANVIIDISFWNKGIYEIHFIDSKGYYLYGLFNID
ncbi:DUF3244 domain-containing protein [Thermophagus xiamenensis]|uniref:DUF3244 domain-containing protein n=1 Tax=Thermophagus xiamenensis TaxID=385682 RepID=A0A1I1VHJ3_9BACT|nr:DUF3244 domain-containing protein [Thermophagus xiamenensis]SFD82265.1 protein of unknown function [Thermophagus xiamenensis]